MEELEPKLLVVELFNRFLGKPLAALLRLAGIEVRNPDHLFPDHVVMAILVMLFIMIFFGLATRRLKPVPGRLQSLLEVLVGFFQGIITDIIGEGGLRYLPVIGSVGIFLSQGRLIIVQSEDADLIEDRLNQKMQSHLDVLLRLLYSTINHFRAHVKAIHSITDSLEEKIANSSEIKYLSK